MCGSDFVERITPYKTQFALWQEHINRYVFALGFAQNVAVLDVACGTGYGAQLLSRKAELVVGVDISSEALAYAKKHYGKAHNLEFILSDAHFLPFRDDTFGSIVSFETIEHLVHYEPFLREVERVLRQEGEFIMSTPNKKLSSTPEDRKLNPFHVKTFCANEISEALNTLFIDVRLYGQRYCTMKNWLFQIHDTLFSMIHFESPVRKIRKLIKAVSNRKGPDEKTQKLVVDTAYRVRKFVEIYPFYSPRFLIAVAANSWLSKTQSKRRKSILKHGTPSEITMRVLALLKLNKGDVYHFGN